LGAPFPTAAGAFRTTFATVFVTKLNPTGSALVYSTFLGGGNGNAIAVDSAGNAYVTGFAGLADFPTTPGAFQTTFRGGGFFGGDAFVTKLNATGSTLVYSTFLGGGGGDDFRNAIAVDPCCSNNCSAYATGTPRADEIPFPTSPGPGCGVGGGSSDAFVAKLNTTGSSLVYSTFLGGSAFDFGRGIAVDPNCSINCSAYVTGVTGSADFP